MSAVATKQSTLEFKWTVSRGRDTYGYNICTLYVDGRKVASCNGGGYDMKGTCYGNFIASHYAERLNKLKKSAFPKQSHFEYDRTRICDGQCKAEYQKKLMDAIAAEDTEEKIEQIEAVVLPRLPEDCYECPVCKGSTRQSGEGTRVDDGRYFYGLTYHDPNYDPSKAVIGKDCSDRTLTPKDVGSAGKTVEQAEADGVSFGLERLQAAYKASSKTPTKRHTVPSIDGACGFRSVEDIAKAIGLSLEGCRTRSKKIDIYILHDAITQESA